MKMVQRRYRKLKEKRVKQIPPYWVHAYKSQLINFRLHNTYWQVRASIHCIVLCPEFVARQETGGGGGGGAVFCNYMMFCRLANHAGNHPQRPQGQPMVTPAISVVKEREYHTVPTSGNETKN
jgi:hypothetical protein